MGAVPAVNTSEFVTVRVGPDWLPAAAARLVSAAAPARRDAGDVFLASARRQNIDLGNLWASVPTGLDPRALSRLTPADVRQVCLATPGAGMTAVVFTTSPADDAEATELASVVERASESARGRLLQALLEPDARWIAHALLLAGFRRLADLAYLRAALPSQSAAAALPSSPLELPPGVSAEPLAPDGDADLLLALERSYIDTLDCPELCALRSTAETLDSHRATGGPGAFDPAYWWLIRLDGQPEGAMLFNVCRSLGHCELVYLGLSPALRGKGLASQLLRHGLTTLARRTGPERLVTCAVDARNNPARRLYGRAGFHEFTTRIAYVRRDHI